MKCLVFYALIVGLHHIAYAWSITTTNFTRSRRQSSNGETCTLPQHPDNGRWTVIHSNGEDQPGGNISINSFLRFDCHIGYKLSTQSQYMVCDRNWDLANVPICEELCPPIRSTSTTIVSCVDKRGYNVSCEQATEGTYLTYTCVPYYEVPSGYKKPFRCFDGTWNDGKPMCQPVCGKKGTDSPLMIYGGKLSKAKEYPWVTPLYKNINGIYTYICGGSIISPRVVLTAAHCVTNNNGDVEPRENYMVAAGKLYNKYNDTRDPNAQYLNIYRIVVHESYKAGTNHFLADIAILVTERSFILNQFIQPICINDVNNIPLRVGSVGVVTGWGITEQGDLSDALKTLEIKYKDEATCSRELPRDFSDKYYNIHTICAGFLNKNVSICKGDSGNALFFKNVEDGRYYVHGIASLTVIKNGQCDVSHNSLYTKVASYYDFADRELFKYTVKDCVLPRYPEHGKWIIENTNKLPGDAVPWNTLLKIVCDPDYHITSSSAYIKCGSSFNMPSCQRTCPLIEDLPPGTVMICNNKDGQIIYCEKATQYSTLSYTCPEGYTVPPNVENIVHCINGTWRYSTPECRQNQNLVAPKLQEIRPLKVICEINWKYEINNIEAMNASLCTHVKVDIGISRYGDLIEPNFGIDVYEKIADMKKINKELKVLLSARGRGSLSSNEYPMMAGNSSVRDTFINNTISFLQEKNFDGLDINWNYPRPVDKQKYTHLLEAVKPELKKHGYLFTATVDPKVSFPPSGYDEESMNTNLDWINVNTYDLSLKDHYTGQLSPMYPSPKEDNFKRNHLNLPAIINDWTFGGIQNNKIVPTIPFLGVYADLEDPDQHGVHSPVVTGSKHLVAYSLICQRSWYRVWDDDQKNPYKYFMSKWIGYEDKESVKIKAEYIKQQGFIGVNIYAANADDINGKCGTKQILLKHVHVGLGNNNVNLD